SSLLSGNSFYLTESMPSQLKAFLLKIFKTMLAKNILTSLILLFSIVSFSQNYTLTGKVTDTQNNPLEYAIISIQDPETFEELAANVSDVNGEFSVEVEAGDYILYIESFTGNIFEQPIEVTQNQNLGSFKLEESSAVALEGVTITGNNQTYRMELDKKVYDLSQDIMARGSSLSDALENVPSVQVDGEGNISLRGNENVRILIDGKPSSLVGISDPATALESLPADVVERIEIVTNPSARYEAEGAAGIINIILKKGKLQGFNGSINVNGGIPTSYGAAANLNYRTGKWNLFTNLSYRYAEREREGNSYTTRFNSEGIPRYEDMDREATRINDGYNIMLGTEYYLDPRNTFTLSGNYRFGKNENLSDIFYNDYDSNLNLTNSSLRTEREKEDDFSIEGNFNYKHEFLDPGHEFTIDARVTYSEEKEDGDLREIGDLVNSTEKSFSSEVQNRVILSADYVYPFGEKGRLELGARGEMTSTLT